MIVGECPYEDCDEQLMTAFTHLNLELPKLCKITCDKCNREHWIKLTRIDPQRWTLEDFDKLYFVDEETKQIIERK